MSKFPKNQINEELKQLKKDLKTETEKLNDKIVNLYISFNILQQTNVENMKEIEKDLKKFIKDSISFKSGEYVLVYNPIQKTTTNLNSFISDFYNCFYKLGGATIEQYDKAGIDMELYDSLEITIENYDLKGYFILFKYIEMSTFYDRIIEEMKVQNDLLRDDIQKVENLFYMLSPFTGEIAGINNVVNMLADLHKIALSAEDFDSKNITAENFDLLNITTYDFDWKSKNII